MNRLRDHGNCYKGKQFNWVAYSSIGLAHYHHGRIWWQDGRHGAGEGAESGEGTTSRTHRHTGCDLSIYETETVVFH